MIYWTVNSVPELKGLKKPEQIQRFKQIQKEGKNRLGMPQIMLRIAIYIVLVGLVYKFWPTMLFAGEGYLPILTMCAVIGALVALPAIVLIQTPIIDKGREWLREQGYPK